MEELKTLIAVLKPIFTSLRESKYELFIANGQFCLCKTMFGPFWEVSILLKCEFDNLEM